MAGGGSRLELPVSLHRQCGMYTCLASCFEMVGACLGTDYAGIFRRYMRKMRALDPRLTRVSFGQLSYRYSRKGKDVREYALTDWLGGIPTRDTLLMKAAVRALELYDVTLMSTNPLFGKPVDEILEECAKGDGSRWDFTGYEMMHFREYLSKGGKVKQVKAETGWLEELVQEEKIPVIAVSKPLVPMELEGKAIGGLHAYVVCGFDDAPRPESKPQGDNHLGRLLRELAGISDCGPPAQGKVLVADPIAGKIEVDKEVFELVWGDSEKHGAYTMVLRKKKAT